MKEQLNTLMQDAKTKERKSLSAVERACSSLQSELNQCLQLQVHVEIVMTVLTTSNANSW